ncbi:MAG: class II aldolase/adducin family protein [Alphaproteobacteria bacterium]
MIERTRLAQTIIDACLRMNAENLNQGTSGNISARFESGFLITPSGTAYERLKPESIVFMTLNGEAEEGLKPSSEWRMHRDIYAARPDAGAVVHAHPPYATALSSLRLPIPAFHYMVAIAGGDDIRCADYATFGTPELSSAMLAALSGRTACLLANHGLICFDANVDKALALAVEVEALSHQYTVARRIGTPTLLTDAEMAEAIAKFRDYKNPQEPAA